MGILVNALAILAGGLLGSLFRSRLSFKQTSIFGISVMFISAIGIIENMFRVSETQLESSDLFVVVFALILGTLLGEGLKMEARLGRLSAGNHARMNAFMDATVFFGIGGLQICGPILLAICGDSSQLYLKSIIDFPFAVMFGAMYGKVAMLSAFPVAAVQVLIAAIAFAAGDFISGALLAELCAVGYIILLLSGFNMLCEPKHKIGNVNMLPAIPIIIIYNLILNLWR